MELSAGQAFGPYRILGPLGRGGMASVYRARDPALERDVALKVLPAEFLHDPAFAERFRQEARVAGRLEHPHIVPVHAFGIEQGAPWMAMRLVTGGSLAERVRRGPLAPREAAAILRDVAGALDYAHERGIVHRDVKPANVLLDETGRGYLADFGVARMLEGSSVVTTTGMIQGTPSYMAPEQAMGEKVDRLADVYALGIVAFECLTGRVPYTGTTPVAILMKHVQEPVPEPTAAEVSAQLSAVLRRCLAKAPRDRWASAGAFVAALDSAAAGATPPSLESLPTLEVPTVTTRRSTGRRTRAWVVAGVIGVLAALLVAGAILSRVWPAGTPARSGNQVPVPPSPTAAPTPAPRPTSTVAAAARATPRPRVPVPTPTPVEERTVAAPTLPDEPAVIGMRKVRVRILLGGESVELTGQDSMTGFNTWSGAAGGAAKQVETWLSRRVESPAEEGPR